MSGILAQIQRHKSIRVSFTNCFPLFLCLFDALFVALDLRLSPCWQGFELVPTLFQLRLLRPGFSLLGAYNEPLFSNVIFMISVLIESLQ